MKKNIEYAIYDGDTFVDLGTAEYLAKKLNIRRKTITYFCTPSYLKRIKDDPYKRRVIKIED